MTETVELVPTLDAQIAVAVGALREELLPTEEKIAEKIPDSPAKKTMVAWIVFAVEACRQLIRTRLEFQESQKDLDAQDLLTVEGLSEDLLQHIRELRERMEGFKK